MSVTEAVGERYRSSFCFSKDTFDAVAISMFFVSEIEAMAVTGVVEWCRAVDEKHGGNESLCDSFANQKPAVSGDVLNVVFLPEFREERVSDHVRSGLFKLRMEQFVGLRIDCSVQPVLLIIESNHRFINHDAIRTPSCFRL